MILKMFTVKDIKADAYLPPFFVQTKGLALRSFIDLANDPSHNFGKYPEDYCLFEIGAYDDSNASFDALTPIVSLGLALDFKKENK